MTANFAQWGGVVVEKGWCDSNVTVKWVVCHLQVEFIVLIIRCLFVCCEGCDRCDSKKQKFWYARVRASVCVMRGVQHRASRSSSLSRTSSPSRVSSPSRASSTSRASRNLPL